MPRGKYVNHKGRNRHFTSPEELEEERKNEEAKKKWRNQHEGQSSEDDEEEAENEKDGEGSDEESSSEEEDDQKKGVAGLIEIENPNRVQKKTHVKATAIASTTSSEQKPELSRREREQIEKQKAQAAYAKKHAEGKTDQAKADLARLAIIKQHRAEAAARREQDKKDKDAKK